MSKGIYVLLVDDEPCGYAKGAVEASDWCAAYNKLHGAGSAEWKDLRRAPKINEPLFRFSLTMQQGQLAVHGSQKVDARDDDDIDLYKARSGRPDELSVLGYRMYVYARDEDEARGLAAALVEVVELALRP